MKFGGFTSNVCCIQAPTESMSKQENHSQRRPEPDRRVRSGEGVGSVVLELNKRIGQQQQQPQARLSAEADLAPPQDAKPED